MQKIKCRTAVQDSESESERQRQRQRQRDRERQRQRRRQRDRDGDRETETERQRDRDRETERQRETEKLRETERQSETDRDTQRQRDRDRERQRNRDRETEIETEKETETDRQTDRQRHTQRNRRESCSQTALTAVTEWYCRTARGEESSRESRKLDDCDGQTDELISGLAGQRGESCQCRDRWAQLPNYCWEGRVSGTTLRGTASCYMLSRHPSTQSLIETCGSRHSVLPRHAPSFCR